MNRVLKHFIAGLILSVIVAVALIVFINVNAETSEEKLSLFQWIPIVLLVILFGSIGYTLVKLWHDWFARHFVFFTKNPLQYAITKYIIDPIIGIVGFNVLGFYLLIKMDLLNIFDTLLSK